MAPSDPSRFKRKFVKDALWGQIEFLQWEERLRTNFLINRLNNVVQNSCAYKVYPGLKHTRFSHSLGVVHVCTEIFRNIVLNVVTPFAEQLAGEAKKATGILGQVNCDQVSSGFESSGIRVDRDYAPLLAGLRVAALYHDIGHLPLSHVFEHSLEFFLKGELGSMYEPNKETADLRRRLAERLSAKEVGEKKLHEYLGGRFLISLDKNIIGKCDELPVIEKLVEIAYSILHTSSFPIARTILDADLDADRIDFIRRDGFNSGLFSSAVDYTRLFSFFSIASDAPQQDGHQTILADFDDGRRSRVFAVPSPRAQAESEKLIWERFLDYKYIVAHHRVHLFDELLERIILRLLSSGALNKLLNHILALVSPSDDDTASPLRANRTNDHHRQIITSMDDAWIEVKIRDLYDEYFAKDEVSEAFGDRFIESSLHAYLEYSGNMVSAFKRDEEFWAQCENSANLEAIKKADGGDLLRQYAPRVSAVLRAQKLLIEREIYDKFGLIVITGDTFSKLGVGLKSEKAAGNYGLRDLRLFLENKRYSSMLFNFWTCLETQAARERFNSGQKAEIFRFILNRIIHILIH